MTKHDSHCSTVGHLSKKCRARNGKSINQVGTVPVDDSTDSAPTVNTVRASTTPVQYAAIPIDDDPLAEPTGPMVNNVSLVTSPAQGVSMVQDNVSTPCVRITLQGHLVQALVDTGANISAIRTSIANKLGVSPDVTKAAQFKIANNDNAASRGTVAIPTMIGPINTVLTYHVVDNLSHSAIVGYPQLKRLGAVIHTDTNVIRFPMESSPGLSGLSGRVYRTSSRGSSGSAPLVCTMASHLRLPGQHHAYVDILGPPNSSVFVSTPFELAAEKLLTVASGVVDFDKNGIATVKLANLDNKLRHINKGQQIATYQYLSPSLKFYSLSPELTVNNVETTTTSCPVDFSPYIGQHLSHSEQTAMQELLQEFPACFNSKPTTVTPLVKHTIDTGDSRPLSQPPHRASAAENETIDSLIDDMLKQGIIRPSNSPWSSPVVIVRKHDGSPRFCVDYRRLNAATTKDVYPLPRVDDTIHSLGQATVRDKISPFFGFFAMPRRELNLGLRFADETFARKLDKIIGVT
ncbi:hypothetical protein G6F57_014373 [Rhizopus arrhizus]|nr:hypothetical protein G6F30_012823 [Rhizopus arrhizus]KAG0975879.1 hypothetical protein G6F28_012810 [Rhizopus arrhizus]KAG1001673.1 hypothetical protein G6F27_012655 [Rhizopus arrhizus]KAG1026359.1 hypothetical protein G6F25_012690 [Rhizopus arrhizus]KAG1060752.1 hypothetical protein G6F41_012662 [Rhizopus arrhizus]